MTAIQSNELSRLVTPALANRYRIIPIAEDDAGFSFYTDNTQPNQLKIELEMIFGKAVTLEPKTTEWVNMALSKHYRQSATPSLNGNSDFIDALLQDAQGIGSSDIHIEPGENGGRVRMRIDGKLIERYQIQKADYNAVVNKVKVRSNMDISEKRLPQDGRISTGLGQDGMDLRVSCLPVMYGEKVVLRLLGRSSGNLTLSKLGMSETQQETYRKVLNKPHGIILISGPTGSGKTTTLYATLQEISDTTRNVMTIEDPIEYMLNGIAQVQVREQIGLTFPMALRTFLRQDPDVIMIGEIRDSETATMAIRASLTGHQVLSTIHTNSAWDTIMRLQDMGIPGYLISSTLVLSVAQRLIRLVCSHCATTEELSDTKALGSFANVAPKTFSVAVGCEKCHYTGYKGRTAIYEILPIDEELAEKLKIGKANRAETYARLGVSSLAEQVLELLRSSETTLQETMTYFIE